ncbi:TRAP transporter large permease subunit [Chloroflexota bacterium]
MVVIGGLYGGVVTPIEVGALGSFIGLVLVFIARFRGRAHWADLWKALMNTARTSAMIFALLIGGGLFGLFVTMTGGIEPLTEFLTNLPYSPLLTTFLIMLVHIPMRMFLDGMFVTMLLTAPITFPIVVNGFGFSPIWLGILSVKMNELGAITPPMAMTVYVIKGLFPDIAIGKFIRGCIWFMAMDLLTFVILFVFPALSIWLPSMMMG